MVKESRFQLHFFLFGVEVLLYVIISLAWAYSVTLNCFFVCEEDGTLIIF